MVEAAFMMPMFVILYFTSIYFYQMGWNQLDVNNKSREAAWVYAMDNCGQVNDPDPEVYQQGNPYAATEIPTTVGSIDNIGDSAGSALTSASTSGGVSTFVNAIANSIATVFPNPMGSQKEQDQPLTWWVTNLYSGAAATSHPVNSTIIKQVVVVYCDEAPQDGNLSKVISNFLGLVKSLL